MRRLSVTWAPATRDWVERLARSERAADPAERARREAFLTPRLLLAAGVLVAAPLWIVVNGAPTLGESAIFALAQAPLLSVAALMRFDDLRTARWISAFGWLALAAAAPLAGAGAGAAAGLAGLALLEAALAFDPALAASLLALLAVSGLGGGALLGLAPLGAYALLLAHGVWRVERIAARASARDRRDLSLLREAAGDLVIVFDAGGAVSSLFGEAPAAHGLEARALMGRGFFQRVHVGDRPAFLKLVSDTAATGEPASATLRLRIGETQAEAGGFAQPVFRDFEARSRRQEADEASGAVRVVCILRDVTAARRAAEDIAAARHESELAEAGKTRFLANMSHELRTPLNAIIGFSEMLASERLAPAEAEKRREYAQIIRNSGQHLLAVVNSILDMSKIESGAMQIVPEPFSLPELVDQCVSMMQLEAEERGVAIERDFPRRLEELVGDKRACKQIVINLLSNAVKFTPSRGRVRIRAYADGNCVALAVSDSGIGIAAGDLGRLGDPFFQASARHDRAYEGTGLGLSVVRGLVGLHGGTIAIESAPACGTCVTVRLPLDCRPHQGKPPALAKIETIARLGAMRQGEEVGRDDAGREASDRRVLDPIVDPAEDRMKKIA